MNQFKAGDKVITTQEGGWYEPGETYTLTEQYRDKGWFTKEQGGGLFLSAGKIQLLPPKHLLTNGRRVLLRNGKMWTVIDNALVNFVGKSKAWSSANIQDRYNDDLTHFNSCYSSNFDIMEVFEKPKAVVAYFDYDTETPSLWKREEKSEAEKQLEEIQASINKLTEQAIELGKQIKQEQL